MKSSERPASFNLAKDLFCLHNSLRTKFQSFFGAKVFICFSFQFIQPVGYPDCAVLICIFTFCCIRTANAVLTPVMIPSGFIPCFCPIFSFSHMHQILSVVVDKTVCFGGFRAICLPDMDSPGFSFSAPNETCCILHNCPDSFLPDGLNAGSWSLYPFDLDEW